MSEDMTKRYEEMAEHYLNCLKFKLNQDGVPFREEIVQALGKWIVAKPKRVVRYEALDMKLIDQFLDFAWSWIKDSSKSIPAEPPEPQQTPAAPRRDGRIDWNAIQEVAFARPAGGVGINNIPTPGNVVWDPNAAGQWVMFDQNGHRLNR